MIDLENVTPHPLTALKDGIRDMEKPGLHGSLCAVPARAGVIYYCLLPAATYGKRGPSRGGKDGITDRMEGAARGTERGICGRKTGRDASG